MTFRSAPWKELTQKVIFLSGVEFPISCSFHRALGRKPVNLETVVGASSDITPVCAHPSLVFLNEGGWVLVVELLLYGANTKRKRKKKTSSRRAVDVLLGKSTMMRHDLIWP